MFIKKSTILFNALFIVSCAFTSQAFGATEPRNVNSLRSNPNIHTRKDPGFQESFSQSVKAYIAEQIELLQKKRAELL